MKPRKLKILCLHGVETNAEIFEFQLKTFKETFDELIELSFVDAPHWSARPRYGPFKKRGFAAPYRKWFELEYDVFYKTEDRFKLPYTEELLHLLEPSIVFLVDYINKTGPYDGLLGFSQGTFAIRMLFIALQYFSKKLKLTVTCPSFCILFSAPHFLFYSGVLFGHFIQSPAFIIAPDGTPLHSLHILNNRLPEPYWWYMHDYKHFESPTVIIHDEDHRPPKRLKYEQVF